MISDKAVEAALTAYMDGDADQAKWLLGKERLEGSPSVKHMRAALLAALPYLDEPVHPATIKRLLDDMDAENMPNERRAEILAIRIRRATPEEAATVPAFEESGHGEG